jgi:hypothetical protein
MAAPVPILLHIVGATVFCVAGAFQFGPGSFRRGWHRRAGRVVLPCGLVAALAGVWLTLFATLPPTDGPLLGVFRVVFGGGMAAALVLALFAIRRRDIVAHRAWVMRGYAIGMGAGTQAVVFGIYAAAAGTPGVTGRALLLGVGWVLNLVVAERIIRRERRR